MKCFLLLLVISVGITTSFPQEDPFASLLANLAAEEAQKKGNEPHPPAPAKPIQEELHEEPFNEPPPLPSKSSKPTPIPAIAVDQKIANVAPNRDEEFGCVKPFACVPFYQCQEGEIITNGEGIIDIRFGGGKTGEPAELVGGNCANFLDVCCRDPDGGPITTPPPPPYQPQCGHRNELGIDVRITFNSSRHQYDHEAQYGEFPWMAVLLKPKEDDPNVDVYQCGASLIHKDVVLTAAHCVDTIVRQPNFKLKVRLGEWDTTNEYEPYPHQDRYVRKIVIHPHYRRGPLFNDVAILFLDAPVELNTHIDTICMPKPSYSWTAGQYCVASGFGKNSFGIEGKYQVVLKKIDLPIVSNQKCLAKLRTTKLGTRFRLHPKFMCAGGVKGEDTCKGDGGGPLVCFNQETQSWHQAGIVAWGIGCGENGVPGVYVDVAKFTHWIDEQIIQELGLNELWGYSGTKV